MIILSQFCVSWDILQVYDYQFKQLFSFVFDFFFIAFLLQLNQTINLHQWEYNTDQE